MNVSFKDFMMVIIKKWYIIVASVVVALAASLLITRGFMQKEYQSNAMVMFQEEDNASALDENVLSHYIAVGLAKSVLDTVNEEPSVKALGYTSNELKKMIALTKTKEKTASVLVVTCKAADPTDAKKILTAYVALGLDAVQALGPEGVERKLIEAPEEGLLVNESVQSGLIYSALAGFLIAVAAVELLFLKINRIKDEEDWEELSEKPILMIIPEVEDKHV